MQLFDLTPYEWTDLPDGTLRLEKALRLRYANEGFSMVIVIERGFESDGFSVPSLARWIVPQRGEGEIAAVIHDYLCKHRIATSGIAHTIFAGVLRQTGMAKWRRWCAATAVLLFGPRW